MVDKCPSVLWLCRHLLIGERISVFGDSHSLIFVIFGFEVTNRLFLSFFKVEL